MRSSHVERIAVPWIREGSLTRKLFHDAALNGKARFHKYDLWHCFHLGAGKHFLGSGLMLLQSLVPAPNIDQRFAIISAAYAEFCRSNGMTRIIGKIDQYLCGFTLPEPQGTWNKAAVTSNICLFVEDYLSCHQEMTRGHQRLQHFVTLFDQALHRCDFLI